LFRHSVKQNLNRILDAKADRLCNADKYKAKQARGDTRAGYYQTGGTPTPQNSSLF
jgi:putative transposase